ncbi:hypothetical protein [Amycolatopsis regifaucium]|uniref:Uncharacterized protein n=1 Tax=Amycolatopsis regifaucium TaxID=546365 RepID=A0A154MDL1_9PSEU|nr:hypothetical protein [Amycolatopsis regifaucium]KZB82566.1 hypothetical protein AVL48_07985 [Amycolatopsis regifaucium]OKA06037.1 hypothetical protein ATP06_0223010 [Amycolatopsis regifaucium]SFG75768.1 hypothetical protein SAMN04489731_101373 [Amycolatopsis regifaucium]
MKSLVHASTALSVLALGFAGFAGTASAAPATPFEVCSPLGCAVQSVRGTVEKAGGQTRVSATVTDSSPASKLTAQFVLSGPSTEGHQVVADNETKRVVFTGRTLATKLTVTACGGGGCNTKSIPL